MINIDKVSFSYDDNEVISNISLSVKSGERIAVIGKNGVGKTTLLKLISGSLIPDKGVVKLNDKVVLNIPQRERAKEVAYVSQRTPDTQDFTVYEVLLTGRYAHSKLLGYKSRDHRITNDIINSCDLSEYRDRIFRYLSKGEQKRVLLGRSLVQETSIVLLDEPTSELDIKYQNELIRLILDESEKASKTVIAVMHDLVLASRYFERLILLHEGKILDDGKPDKVITSENIQKAYDMYAEITWFNGYPIIKPNQKE